MTSREPEQRLPSQEVSSESASNGGPVGRRSESNVPGAPSRISILWVVLLALVLSAAYSQTLHYATAQPNKPNDFVVYYVAAKIALRGKKDPLYYSPQTHYSVRYMVGAARQPGTLWDRVAASSGLGPTLHFVTPPFVALLLEPLGKLSWPNAYKVWCWLTSIMVVISLIYILRLAEANPFWPSLAVAVAASFAFFPYIQTMWYGQIDALILLTWTLGVYSWSRGRSVVSAFWFALGTMIKIMPVLAAGVFLIRRQWRWLIAYCFWMACLLGISIWRMGVQNHLDWLTRVYPTLTCGFPYAENRSLASFLQALYFGHAFVHHLPSSVPHFLCWIAKVSGGAVYLSVLVWLMKKSRQPGRLTYELVMLPIVALIVTPMIGRHYFIFALLPILYLWITFVRREGHSRQLKWLALVTLWVGLKLPEYALLKIWPLSLVLLGSWVAVEFLLLWLCLKEYNEAPSADDGANLRTAAHSS